MQAHLEPVMPRAREQIKPLVPRRRYPTLHIKPYRASPLRKLQWIFGFGSGGEAR